MLSRQTDVTYLQTAILPDQLNIGIDNHSLKQLPFDYDNFCLQFFVVIVFSRCDLNVLSIIFRLRELSDTQIGSF